MKYTEAKIVFSEIPDEVTLAINISGCEIQCKDCHSKYLWDNIGEELDRSALYNLIKNNEGITCVAFMGGDSYTVIIYTLLYWLKSKYPEIKTAWYSGSKEIDKSLLKYLDYIKVGPFIKEKGPINCKTTNQRMYKINRVKEDDTKKFKTEVEDITYKFWK